MYGAPPEMGGLGFDPSMLLQERVLTGASFGGSRQRADLRGPVHRVAHAHRPDRRAEALLERLGHVLHHDEPLGRDAALPAVDVAGAGRRFRGIFQVRIR